MLVKSISAVCDGMRRFRAAEGGNFAIMFAVLSVPLVVAIGGTLDYVRASRAHTQMQDAADATALALSRENVATMSATQIQQLASQYFSANFTDADATNITVSP